MALDELGDAEALHALADHVMRAVGRRDVAQDVGDRADLVEIVRRRARSSPGRAAGRPAIWRCSRTACWAAAIVDGPADAHREDDLREQDEVAHRHDDERIGGRASAGSGESGWRAGRRVGVWLAFTSSGAVMAASGAALVRLTTRQPFADGRGAPRRSGPAAAATRRSNRPCGSSRRWMVAVRSSGRQHALARDHEHAVLDRRPPPARHRRRAGRRGSAPRRRFPARRPAAPSWRPAREACGRNTWRCSRSACASMCSASDHIQSRGSFPPAMR